MTDRELLELAAKAAGIEYNNKRASHPSPALYLGPSGGWWNPLQDYGEALGLALKLRMSIVITATGPSARAEDHIAWCDERIAAGEDCGPALCRAIVRAAAEVGARLPLRSPE